MEKDIIIISELSYNSIPKNTKYYEIAFENNKTKKSENQKLWNKIKNDGVFIKNNYTMDFLVSTYKYQNAFYELWFNDNHGYIDSIKKYTI